MSKDIDMMNNREILESYDLPKSIKKKLGITNRTFKRVFRDEEELPLSSNLEDPIVDALENSKYLKQYEEEKREAGIKKIMQKETNINVLFRKIMDENIVLKNKIKKNDNLIEYKKYKQNLKEKEFNFYVKFE